MNRSRSRSKGVILTGEFICLLPLFIGVALVTLQFMFLGSAKYRVEAATIEGARLAARGESHENVHKATMAFLAPHLNRTVETRLQFKDMESVGSANPAEADVVLDENDYLRFAVRIPQTAVWTNYLGFFGGSLDGLQLRSVVTRRLEVTIRAADSDEAAEIETDSSPTPPSPVPADSPSPPTP